jgi:ATP-dependent Lhr-like helicase
VDTPIPSQFAHELLNANPYAYLDEAGLEERRARATTLRRDLPDSIFEGAGRLDQHAIDTVRRECWPDIRDEHELHDLLQSLVALPLTALGEENTRHWPHYFTHLEPTGRATTLDCNGTPCWIATERLPHAAVLWSNQNIVILTLSEQSESKGKNPRILPEASQNFVSTGKSSEAVTKEAATKQCVQGWLQILGPTTANVFATRLNLDPAAVFQAFLAMEMQGLLMRGAFEHPATNEDHEIEWCERRILQRIHRLTLSTRRKQIEAVSPAVYMRWLLNWQHLAPQTQLSGEEGVLEALRQLEGFEAPAIEWERTLLPARVANYDPRHLDALCLSGAVGWGRVSPHPAWSQGDGAAPRRVIPTNAAPITFYVRESADWLPHALAQQSVEESKLAAALSTEALHIRALLQQRGACFSNDIQRIANLTRSQTQQALWELATAGLAAADGFDQLRIMMDPRRKPSSIAASGKRTIRSSAGRWSLLNEPEPTTNLGAPCLASKTWAGAPTNSKEREDQLRQTAIEKARRTDAAHESAARMLLNRYGILFRDLLDRESNIPKWRELLGILRRLEARGEVRGGRFVTGFGGEQFALPQAVESLRASRTRDCEAVITVAAADPINLIGIVIPGDRVSAIPGKQLRYRNGRLHSDESPTDPNSTVETSTALIPATLLPAPTSRSESRLFQ